VRGERSKEKDAMLASIFAFIHVLLNLIAICAGATVLFGLLTGELLRKWPMCFLESSLLASITSFTFSVHHLRPAEEASMLSVYVAGAAILAWRKYHLAGVWSSVFAATSTMILYLNVFVAMAHAFGNLGALKALSPAHSMNTYMVIQLLAAVLFAVLGTLAIRRFHPKPTHSF
jgi:cellulose synthase/poly-beta-1,6-N-acetylglucosamine synthase-like glycosyltransferase